MNKYLLIMALAVVMSLSQSTQAGGLLSAAGDVAAGTVAAATAPLGGRAYYGPRVGYYTGPRYYRDYPDNWYNYDYDDYGPGFDVGVRF